MPTHIARYRTTSDPKIATAKAALTKLTTQSHRDKLGGRDSAFKVTGNVIEIRTGQAYAKAKHDYSWIPESADVGFVVNLADRKLSREQARATRNRLKKIGYVRVSLGIYEYRGKP
jgi:hypothetical protein